jgi:hypothetical protein
MGRTTLKPCDGLGHWLKVGRFYKGESQEKNFPRGWRKRSCPLCYPAHVLLRGSGGFLFLQIHLAFVTTPSASDADKQRGCKMPTMVLSEARGL